MAKGSNRKVVKGKRPAVVLSAEDKAAGLYPAGRDPRLGPVVVRKRSGRRVEIAPD